MSVYGTTEMAETANFILLMDRYIACWIKLIRKWYLWYIGYCNMADFAQHMANEISVFIICLLQILWHPEHTVWRRGSQGTKARQTTLQGNWWSQIEGIFLEKMTIHTNCINCWISFERAGWFYCSSWKKNSWVIWETGRPLWTAGKAIQKPRRPWCFWPLRPTKASLSQVPLCSLAWQKFILAKGVLGDFSS